MLPVWVLVPPTVLHGVAHYTLYTVAKGLSALVLRRRLKEKQASEGALSKEEGLVFDSWQQYQEQGRKDGRVDSGQKAFHVASAFVRHAFAKSR